MRKKKREAMRTMESRAEQRNQEIIQQMEVEKQRDALDAHSKSPVKFFR